MKKILIVFLFVISIFGVNEVFGQSKQYSNSEKFVEEPGRILEKEMVTMGVLDVKYNLQKQTMNINTLVMKDLMTEKATSCLVFELIKKTKYAYIDPDEIAGLTNMFKLMQKKYINSVRTNYTELGYSTRGGTEAGCFFDEDKWIVFLRLDKSEKNTIIEIKSEDLQKFIELLSEVDKMVN